MSVEYEGPGATEIMVVSKTNGDSVSELRTIAFVVATLALGLSGDGTDVVSMLPAHNEPLTSPWLGGD